MADADEQNTKRWVTMNGAHVLIGEDDGGGGGGSSGGTAPRGAVGFGGARGEINFVRKRLAAGHLKRGERKMLERREERLAKEIIESRGKSLKGMLGDGDCVALCDACMAECMDCVRQMEQCPNRDAQHDACMAKCKACIASCQMAASDLSGNATLPECQRACSDCANACMDCVEALEAVAESCDHCRAMCEQCSERCGQCADVCRINAGEESADDAPGAPMKTGGCVRCGNAGKPMLVNGVPSCARCGADLPTAAPVIFGAVKAAGDWVLDVLGVPYGGPHGGKDSHGEFFTARTNLHLDKFTPIPCYYHGFTPDGKPQGDPEIIGKVESVTPKADGVWYRIVLNRASAYAQRVWEGAKRGIARASSGTISHLRRVAASGEILNWPVVEISLFDAVGTRQPANAYAVALPAAKAHYMKAGVELQILDGDSAAIGEQRGGGENGKPFSHVQKAHALSAADTSTKSQGAVEMDESKIQELVAKAVAAKLEGQPPVQPVVVVNEEPQATKTAAQPVSDEDKVKNAVEKAIADAFEQQKRRQEEINAAVAQAVKAERNRWAGSNRLPGGDGAPAVISPRSAYDNMEPRDVALLVDILTPPLSPTMPDKKDYSRAPLGAIKALALKLESSEANQGQSDVQVPGVKSTVKVDNRKLYGETVKELREELARFGIKANELDHTTQSGFGAEWVGTAYGRSLWEVIRQDVGVGSRLMEGAVEVPQGFSSIYLPLESTDMTWYKVAEATANNATTGIPDATITASKLATAQKQLTVAKMGARTVWSGEMDEDSLLPWIANLRRQLELSGLEQFTHVVIDGDTETGATTNINHIGGTPGATDLYLLFNGFRKSPLVTTTANSRSAAGGLVAEDFLNTVKLMGSAGVNALDLAKVAFIIDPNVMYKALTLPEVKTRDVNSLATIENGRLTRIFGYDVITSAFMHYKSADRKANTAGKVDQTTPANNTTGSILAVRFDQWQVGFKRRVTVETQRIPQADSTQIVATMRVGMVQRDTEASAVSYNVGV